MFAFSNLKFEQKQWLTLKKYTFFQLVFPIGLVKTESGFIVRSIETGLGR